MITIVDYDMGNLGSVVNMFRRVGAAAKISSDIDEIAKANKILLPGVGSFDAAMQKLNETGLTDILVRKATIEKVPFLGICLGMQLLTQSSEEGKLRGLGILNASTHRFSFDNEQNLKVPHMGWNTIVIVNKNSLVTDLPADSRFYFVHSYYVQSEKAEEVSCRTIYGHEFDSIVSNGDNVYGAQFHPEKSHKYGMKLFENFAKL
jgi:glutamine amidotransferase